MIRLLNRAKAADADDNGFTLIEILVVIIIIGILAAIAIPALLGQRKRGYDASLKSDLRTVATEFETYNTDDRGYPLSLDGTTLSGAAVLLDGDPIHLSKDNSIAVTFNASADAYCLVGSNAKATASWYYVSSRGGLQGSGTSSCGSY
jgi:type IV pilus assembly protein PilA